MSSASKTFQYRPLKEGSSEFRILRLMPGYWNEPITCILEHASLDNPPVYESLSYTWGPPTVVEPILLAYADSIFRVLLARIVGLDAEVPKSSEAFFPKLFVTTNLVKALRRLRKEGAPRPLWVDAICINQADLQERHKQVPRMGLIYSRSLVVTIWLGELQDEAAKAVNLAENDMRTAFSYLRHILHKYHSEGSGITFLNFFEELAKAEAPLPQTLFKTLCTLCHRPWFTRVWVVQEQVVAQRARVLCGDESLEFQKFLRAMKAVLHLLELQEASTFRSSSAVVRHSLFRRMFRSSEFLDLPIGERLLKMLSLVGGANLQSADPRDKIYGLLGLLGDVRGCPILEPDYERPLDEFWLDLTKFLILETSSLCFLQQPDPGSSPSWVSKSWQSHVDFDIDREPKNLRDAMKRRHVVKISESSKLLYAKVLVLGQVSGSVFVHHDLGRNLSHWRDQVKSLEARLEATPTVLERYGTKESIQAALKALIIKNMHDALIGNSVMLSNRYMMLMGRLPPDSSPFPEQKSPDGDDLSNVHRKFLPQTIEFLILSTGYIGFVRECGADVTSYSQVVAMLCIFPERLLVFELRQDGHAYRLSRICEVHGLPDISAARTLERLENDELEDISLV